MKVATDEEYQELIVELPSLSEDELSYCLDELPCSVFASQREWVYKVKHKLGCDKKTAIRLHPIAMLAHNLREDLIEERENDNT